MQMHHLHHLKAAPGQRWQCLESSMCVEWDDGWSSARTDGWARRVKRAARQNWSSVVQVVDLAQLGALSELEACRAASTAPMLIASCSIRPEAKQRPRLPIDRSAVVGEHYDSAERYARRLRRSPLLRPSSLDAKLLPATTFSAASIYLTREYFRPGHSDGKYTDRLESVVQHIFY